MRWPTSCVVIPNRMGAQRRLVREGGLGEVHDRAAVAEVDGHHRLVGQRVADELGVTGTVRQGERQVTPVRR